MAGSSSAGCVSREFLEAQGRCLDSLLLVKVIFFFFSLDVSPIHSPLMPGLPCFCRDKDVNTNRERDIETLLGGKFGSILEHDFCIVGFNPRQGLLAKCLDLICLLGECFSLPMGGSARSPVHKRITAWGFCCAPHPREA